MNSAFENLLRGEFITTDGVSMRYAVAPLGDVIILHYRNGEEHQVSYGKFDRVPATAEERLAEIKGMSLAQIIEYECQFIDYWELADCTISFETPLDTTSPFEIHITTYGDETETTHHLQINHAQYWMLYDRIYTNNTFEELKAALVEMGVWNVEA
jgi:hypothetical protein